jgi:hypothetical protein
MSKLGYTFYPKDWNSSDAVFELTLEERGFYRELIDLAMLNDNKSKININVWSRKYNASKEVLNDILKVLEKLNLISIKKNETLFVPSCETRLDLVRGGRKGGKTSKKLVAKSKPPKKPVTKPNEKEVEKEIEIEVEKEIEVENEVEVNYTESEFLQRWKDARMYYDKKPTNISKLSTFESVNFRNICNVYNKEQIEQAIAGLFQQNTFKTTRLRPTHFLEFEHFEKYLTCFMTKEKLFNDKYTKKIERI